jgi:hypothetical protein
VKRTVSGGRQRDEFEQLHAVVEALREADQLKIYRPERSREYWNSGVGDWYVSEEFVATPVVLPVSGGSDDRTIRIWVGEPLEEREPPSGEWDWAGSFVFLVEDLRHFEWPFEVGYLSGISALRLTVEFVAGRDQYTFDDLIAARREEDKFGRFVDANPIDKLRAAGGIVGRPRLIETVYKIAYMTNEQSYMADGQRVRVNDILAYPLYIAE